MCFEFGLSRKLVGIAFGEEKADLGDLNLEKKLGLGKWLLLEEARQSEEKRCLIVG